MNPTALSGSSPTGDILRASNEKLLIASVHQQELAEIATQAEQRLSALVHGLDAVICEISLRTGEIIFLSDHAELLLGYPRARWNRRGFWRCVIYREDHRIAFSYFSDAIRSHLNQDHEFRVVANDGRVLWTRNRAVVVDGDDGKALLLRCVMVDVSANKEAERIIAHSERRYRRLFETARDGILLLDLENGAITDANPFACELLGFSYQEILGKDLFAVGLFADEQESQVAFTKLQQEHTLHYESLSLRTRLRTIRIVEVVGSVYPENGTTVIQCNIRDITERRRVEVMQAEMLQREQRITEFLQRPLRTHFSPDKFPGLSIAAFYEPAMSEA